MTGRQVPAVLAAGTMTSCFGHIMLTSSSSCAHSMMAAHITNEEANTWRCPQPNGARLFRLLKGLFRDTAVTICTKAMPWSFHVIYKDLRAGSGNTRPFIHALTHSLTRLYYPSFTDKYGPEPYVPLYTMHHRLSFSILQTGVWSSTTISRAVVVYQS